MLPRIVASCLLVSYGLTQVTAAEVKPGPLSPWQMRALFMKRLSGKELDHFRDCIYATFGKKELENGTSKARVQDTMACWAIAITPEQAKAGVVPKLIIGKGTQRVDMRPIGQGSNLFMLFADLPNFSEAQYEFDVSGLRLGADKVRIEHHEIDPASLPRANIPKGTITKYTWKSKIFEGTQRDYSVYVPAQYDAKGPPACVMVFQDGIWYLQRPFSVPTVFDNLIHKKELPVIIGIFINPGVFPGKDGKPPVSNCSVEYDSLSDKYAKFLRDEILPEVGKKYQLRKDPGSRAICGISSGGICSFTVAWEMPDQFARVLSHVGSFTDIRGGHVYPSLIRKNPKKNIRVFLQAGARDLDNEHGNWPLANQQLAAALRFKGYDFQLEMGQGFHSGNHGGAILPRSMRWLWRDYIPPELMKKPMVPKTN